MRTGSLFLLWLGLLLPATAGASVQGAERTVLRVGHFPNITHAQALVGHQLSRQGRGWFEERLGPGVEVQWFVFNAGPTAMESIFARSLDLAYVGPNPAINAHLRTGGEEIRIVAGACSGGAALVVGRGSGIESNADFQGRKVGTPQLGNTQDVAARAWLRSQGFRVTLAGGDVMVVPSSNPDLLALMRRGKLDAVWTIEPWVTRLQVEAEARVHLEEATLWPETEGRYATTQLVSSAGFLRDKPELLRRWLDAHVELTRWLRENPAEAKGLVNAELQELTRHRLPPAILDQAWERLEFTWDPVAPSLERAAQEAHALGFLRRRPDLSRIYELDLLRQVLQARNLAPLP
jgi:NitT/TauT family transport system substrate-binding protein